MKYILTILLALSLLTIAGCGDKPSEGTTTEPTNNSKETTEQKEKVDQENKVLKLGETGRMKDTLGEHDITINSFEILEEYEGNKPYSSNTWFVVVDATINNLGEKALDSFTITRTRLFDLDSNGGSNEESFTVFPEEIQPGETVSGQIIFDIPKSSSYELVFGFALSSVATELRWGFDASEASNK
ncbi:MAG: DUF4352 domain-containing protein [Anaerobacillus sp.]|uniref:DUF4352 domain-containing protein n=1 Tax=Anaerobacillus sp. TaxID=1872506 RepID=UPI00391BDCFC